MTTRCSGAWSKHVQKCGYEDARRRQGDAAVAMLNAPDAPAIDAVVLDL